MSSGSLTITEFSVQITCLVYALTTSLLCLWYTSCKMKLNKYMKLVLILHTLLNSLTSLLKLIAMLMSIGVDHFSRTSCLIFSYANNIFFVSSVMPSMISILRLYMAKLAAKARFAKASIMLLFITFVTLISVSVGPVALAYNDANGFRSSISDCLNLDLPRNPFPAQVGLGAAFVLIMLGLGLFSDIALVQFVKKRSQVQPQVPQDHIVPFQSMTNNKNHEEDMHIPIRATLVSSLCFVSSLLLSIFLMVSLFGNSSFWNGLSSGTVIYASFPILIIVLSVKIKKDKQKVAADHQRAPPVSLQFHEENEPEESNQDQEMNDIVQIEVHEIQHLD